MDDNKAHLLRHAIKLIQRMEPWDGKTFNPELAHTLQLLAAAPQPPGDEAVAWMATDPDTGDRWVTRRAGERDGWAGLGRTITPLFTHPAPDAALHARTEGEWGIVSEKAVRAFRRLYDTFTPAVDAARNHRVGTVTFAIDLALQARADLKTIADELDRINATTPPAPLAPARITAEGLMQVFERASEDGGKYLTDYFTGVEIQRAASALSAKSGGVVDAWRPISEAPRDGTRMILAWNGVSVVGFYLDNSKTPHAWQGWRVPSCEWCPPGQPTHWQPLPPPPAALTPGAKGESDNAAMLSGKREGE